MLFFIWIGMKSLELDPQRPWPCFSGCLTAVETHTGSWGDESGHLAIGKWKLKMCSVAIVARHKSLMCSYEISFNMFKLKALWCVVTDRIRCSCKSLPGMQIACGDPEASPTADAAVKRLHLQRGTRKHLKLFLFSIPLFYFFAPLGTETMETMATNRTI